MTTSLHSQLLRTPVVLSFAILLLFIPNVVKSSSTASSSLPVEGLKASLTASVAQTTTIAMKVRMKDSNDDGVIILSRSPKQTSKLLYFMEEENDDDEVVKKTNGLKLIPIIRNNKKQSRLVAPNVFCTMTGFAGDIYHLTKVLLRVVTEHQMLYQQHCYPLPKLVRTLSTILRHKTTTGRPFGIKALFIGIDTDKSKNRDNTVEKWYLYSCDPSGLYQYYPRGVAIIGKDEEEIRKKIMNNKNNENNNNNNELVSSSSDAMDGLKNILTALLSSSAEDSSSSHAQEQYDNYSFEAIFLLEKNSECCASRIHPDVIKKLILSIL